MHFDYQVQQNRQGGKIPQSPFWTKLLLFSMKWARFRLILVQVTVKVKIYPSVIRGQPQLRFSCLFLQGFSLKAMQIIAYS